jgi:hypothetical protein
MSGAERRAAFIEAVAAAAHAWRDPAHPARAAAVAKTLEAPNRFTEEAVAYAVNVEMHRLTAAALRAWLGERAAVPPRAVGVLHEGRVPMGDLAGGLAVALMGHRWLGAVPEASPHLIPAFVEEVRRHAADFPARFLPREALGREAEALVAGGGDEARAYAAAIREAGGIPPERCFHRTARFSVAVLDGRETEAEREGIAEDALLHEGFSPRNVAILFAPRETPPDPYLEAFALFRSVFPAHPRTPGALRMQKAMLEAFGAPHAYGEGLEFLLSKGEPEPQAPGHLRWSEYDRLDEVARRLTAHAGALACVVARADVAKRLPASLPWTAPGQVHRPPLDASDPLLAFLAGL